MSHSFMRNSPGLGFTDGRGSAPAMLQTDEYLPLHQARRLPRQGEVPACESARGFREGESMTTIAISTPTRIQLSRKKGWKMPDNTVKVDRTTRWGNPVEVVPFTPDGEKELRGINAEFRCFTALEAVFRFSYFLGRVNRDGGGRLFADIMDNLHELKGKNLACWCKVGTPCHADVLLKLANHP